MFNKSSLFLSRDCLWIVSLVSAKGPFHHSHTAQLHLSQSDDREKTSCWLWSDETQTGFGTTKDSISMNRGTTVSNLTMIRSGIVWRQNSKLKALEERRLGSSQSLA